jgi:hypothetical protein
MKIPKWLRNLQSSDINDYNPRTKVLNVDPPVPSLKKIQTNMSNDKKAEILLKILDNSVFFHHTLNMNDTFGWACSDSEEIDSGDLMDMLPLYEKYSYDAFTAYVSVKRGGELPIMPLLTDNFYKAKKEIELLAKDGTVLYEQYWEREGRAKCAEERKLRENKGDKK